MNMKLASHTNLVNDPSGPKDFEHNSISQKMRQIDNIKIFCHFKNFEIMENVIVVTF